MAANSNSRSAAGVKARLLAALRGNKFRWDVVQLDDGTVERHFRRPMEGGGWMVLERWGIGEEPAYVRAKCKLSNER